MDIRVVSSSVEGAIHQFAATYVVNDILAIDAGSIGFSDIGRQKLVRHVLISHGHLDHIGSLPIFIDNVYTPGLTCPIVYASQHALDILKTHFFNDVVWPDVIRLSGEESPFLRFVTLENRQPVTIDRLVVTPIELNHIMPTFGFIVDDGTSAVAFVSDTAPTEAIWEQIQQNPRISAVFLEAAFPNSMGWLAEKAKHLTPKLFEEQYSRAGRAMPVIAVHIKPAFYETVVQELQDLNLDELVISQPNQIYRY
jgi:cAMP phosphodiesterase